MQSFDTKFWRNHPFSQQLHHFPSPPPMFELSSFSTSSPALLISVFLMATLSRRARGLSLGVCQ